MSDPYAFEFWLDGEIERNQDMEKAMDQAGRMLSCIEYRIRWMTYDMARTMFKAKHLDGEE